MSGVRLGVTGVRGAQHLEDTAGRMGIALTPAIGAQVKHIDLHYRDTKFTGTFNEIFASEGVNMEQALEAIRPHGHEHVWRPARPYMLPG